MRASTWAANVSFLHPGNEKCYVTSSHSRKGEEAKALTWPASMDGLDSSGDAEMIPPVAESGDSKKDVSDAAYSR